MFQSDWKIVCKDVGSKYMWKAKQSHGLYNPEQWSFLLSMAKEAEDKRNTFVLQKQLKYFRTKENGFLQSCQERE